MNHKLYKENNPQANYWADKVEQSFKRDKDLCDDYNNVMSVSYTPLDVYKRQR